jgi:hypothetical protein
MEAKATNAPRKDLTEAGLRPMPRQPLPKIKTIFNPTAGNVKARLGGKPRGSPYLRLAARASCAAATSASGSMLGSPGFVIAVVMSTGPTRY